MDKITLNNFELNTLIGTRPEERELPQKVILDLEIGIDLQTAAKSDDLYDTLDYSDLENKLLRLAEDSRFFLLEAFAGAIADTVLANDLAKNCTVTLTKPNASRRATVRVTLNRQK